MPISTGQQLKPFCGKWKFCVAQHEFERSWMQAQTWFRWKIIHYTYQRCSHIKKQQK